MRHAILLAVVFLLSACISAPAQPPLALPAKQAQVAPAPAPWQPLPRSAWTTNIPNLARAPMMGQVTRIVIRHEGWKAVTFDDKARTIDRLEGMRLADTVNGHHWADIRMHYLIDRAGRTWECRPADHQGCVVEGCNDHTLGVMVLGDFDAQTMTPAQEAELHHALLALCQRHHLPASAIYGKCEMKAFCPTVSGPSPGKHVMEKLIPMRAQLAKELAP